MNGSRISPQDELVFLGLRLYDFDGFFFLQISFVVCLGLECIQMQVTMTFISWVDMFQFFPLLWTLYNLNTSIRFSFKCFLIEIGLLVKTLLLILILILKHLNIFWSCIDQVTESGGDWHDAAAVDRTPPNVAV